MAAILGVSSAGIVTSIVYLCRNKIQSLFYLTKKQFTVTFLITNDSGTAEVYGLILKWLKKYNKLYTRSLTAPQQLYVDELSKEKISDALQYGLGRHLIWFHKRPIWLHIYEEKLENSRERKLYLSMSIIGRSHNLIYDLLDEVYKWNKDEEIQANKDKTRVNIYGYSGINSWEIIRKRGFDTIYLSSKIENEIKHNIQKFLDNEQTYIQHGIPYHYGMILYGPPGTGKTSIIKAIASEFDFDISLIDPLNFDITRLRENKEKNKIKMLVIEDIDLLLGTKRETVEDIDIDEDEEDIIGEIIKYDIKIPIFWFKNSNNFVKDDNGKEYNLIYTEKDKLGILIEDIRKKNIGIRDYSIPLAERNMSNILFYCNEDSDYIYFSYDNLESENDYIKFSKVQLLMDCKRNVDLFSSTIYSESDDKEYNLLQFEHYVPHNEGALINGIKKDVIQLAYIEVINSKPNYYDLYYEYDDEEYIYFSKKICIKKNGVLTSEYNTDIENDIKEFSQFNYSPKMSAEIDRDVSKPRRKNYDYSIPINILENNNWEKPFNTNEGDGLYIWLSGFNNPIDNIPSQGINFMKQLIAENLYFFDTLKGINYNKVYKYISHDKDNIYLKEKTDYIKPQFVVESTGHSMVIKPKTKVIQSGKDSAGKKVLRELMNAIDGLVTKENFIIIATTNSIESLDPTLIRPGRFDTAIKIDYIDIEVFNKAMIRYFGKTVDGTLKKRNLTISKLQVEFLMGKTFEDFKRKYVK